MPNEAPSSQEASSQEASSQEASSQEASSQEASRQEISSQETSSADLVATLRSLNFCKGWSDAQVQSLADMAKVVEFSAGTVVFSECEPATHCYLLVSGHVLLEICGPDKCTTILTIGPGELLGWSTVLGAARMTATARCQEPTRAIELVGSEVQIRCTADPSLGYQFMKSVAKTLSGRLTATRLQLLDLYRG